MHWSMSLFLIYFGTRRQYPGSAHHTVLFGPRYREMLREIFHGPALPPDFSLYLHQPTVTDPSLAPPGCESFYVLAPVPHLGSAPVDWSREGAAYADRILAALETVLPGLRREIVQRIFTPVDFREQLNAYQGSAFSVAPRLSQSAYFRPHNRDPEIPGLYIVGAGTHPGAGVPGVINSGKATARLILEDFGQRRAGARVMTHDEEVVTRRILAHHSKSFALAGKLLPLGAGDDAGGALRLVPAVRRRRRRSGRFGDARRGGGSAARELDAIYAGQPQREPVLAAMQDVVTRHGIPRRYCDDLLAGMAMDVGVVRYRTLDELLLYCYRAAGTVGLMMAHVMGVRDAGTLRRAADLGLAMQLTNICRDVAEDARRGRVYLPTELWGGDGAVTATPERAASAIAEVLRRADELYRSGDAGLGQLPLRCAVAIRAARLIYGEIGGSSPAAASMSGGPRGGFAGAEAMAPGARDRWNSGALRRGARSVPGARGNGAPAPVLALRARPTADARALDGWR
jgi:hypothetical protein